MGIRMPRISHVKYTLQRSSATNSAIAAVLDVPKGCLAVYVGESQRKRFVVPVSYLSDIAFQNFLGRAVEEFGFDYPEGGLTIPCGEDMFRDLMLCLRRKL